MAIYIKGMGNISPQQSWNDDTTLLQAFDYRGNKVKCVDPNDEEWIDPKQWKSMSRVIKRGVSAAMMALKEANVESPDGIIMGTGFGNLEDTETLLSKQLYFSESVVDADLFLQSQPNAIGRALDLVLKCEVYNQTYSQNAFSFENGLLDASMQLMDSPEKNLIVGGIDEITATSHAVLDRFGIFRKKLASTLNIFKTSKKGTINGEGAACFVLSGNPNQKCLAVIDSVQVLYKPTHHTLHNKLEIFLRESGLLPSDIDLVLLGKSGDKHSDVILDDLCKTIFPQSTVGLFKHLCGEYPTASAFALWLGTRILVEGHVPEVVRYKSSVRPLKNVLIFNAYLGTHYSFILIRSCRDII